MGLGAYPEVSLADARDKARELRKQVRNGVNPLEEKHAARAEQEKLAHKKNLLPNALKTLSTLRPRNSRTRSISRSGVQRLKRMLIRS
jgi:vacuolar-type H+-ATPase subunit H